ncbi:MAG TPA: ABC transporter permease subunit [Candidatus Acidoferrales bacterium]
MTTPSPPSDGSLPPALLAGGAAGKRTGSRLADLAVFAAVLGAAYGVLALGHSWLGPVHAVAQISRSPAMLPLYAVYSLVRLGIAYGLSVVFALAYGFAAARSPKLERVLVPLMDILQSIPVLSFLPGVMLAMMALFPGRRVGVELGSILLIFTGMVWNIAFSFYSSLKTIPRELDEAVRVYGFGRWQRFFELELPFGAIGLVWNSMMSVAGGWFFLMPCEMFVLGERDFRLPGLGSYLQVAAGAGDTGAILWGLAVLIAVIVLLDQIVWRPILAWADKFKFEQVEAAHEHQASLLGLLGRSRFAIWMYGHTFAPAARWLTLAFAPRAGRGIMPQASKIRSGTVVWTGYAIGAALAAGLAYGVFRAGVTLADLHGSDISALLRAAGFTFFRVNAALLLGALWTVPAGVAIGSSPRLARLAQPLVQIAASVPATALFPVVLLVLVRWGGGMGTASLLLMLLGTQWYILFNVIAGAMAIPTDLKEAAEVFHFTHMERWRRLILPGIFPYLVTGLLTASGGAWNASIIAEYFHFRGRTLMATGLGSTISAASDSGRFDVLLAATILMAIIVVVVNRVVWKRLYQLAGTRYKLET